MTDLPQPTLECAPHAAAASMLWRSGDRLHLTVVAKAALAFVREHALSHESGLAAREPSAVQSTDAFVSTPRGERLATAAELVPYLRRTDVLLSGQVAPASSGEDASVRLAVFRDSSLVDKTIIVRGQPSEAAAISLGYDHAAYDAERNPVGVDPAYTRLVAVPPEGGPAGFGPISPAWAPRRRLMDPTIQQQLTAPIPTFDSSFDWELLQAAPRDQQCDYLRGDEWLVLEGLEQEPPIIKARLPGVAAEVWVSLPGEEGPRPLEMRMDGLRIDATSRACVLLWRGSFPVDSERDVAAIRIGVAMSTAAQRRTVQLAEASTSGVTRAEAEPPHVAVPTALEPEARVALGDLGSEDERALLELAAQQRTVALAEDDHDAAARRAATPFEALTAALPATAGTALLSEAAQQDAAGHTALPFERSAVAAGRPPLRHAAIPGAPWAAEPAAPAPSLGDAQVTITLGDGVAAQAHQPTTVGAVGWIPRPPTPPEPLAKVAEALEVDRPGPPPRRPVPVPATEPVAPRAPLPRRLGHTIPTTRLTPLELVVLRWQLRPPRDSFSVVVKGTFDLLPDGPAKLRGVTDTPTGDITPDGDPLATPIYPSDLALFKPQADVVLLGHAYAPEGSDVASAVLFRFGHAENGFSRCVGVFGPRHWTRKAGLLRVPSEPQSFAKVPLTYEQAFGGPDCPANPAGMGWGAKAGEDDVALLPRLEQPSRLIAGPNDAPEPACFAPIPMMWKSRWSKLGTYDGRWRKERWPYFPKDFDWTFFQCAPPAQQLEHLVGDEPFEVVGAHPEHRKLRGTLPGLRPRCVAQRSEEAGGELFEILLRLDTVVLDMDQLRIHLVWRGVLEVSSPRAPELAALALLHEPLDESPASLERIRQQLEAAAAPPEPVAISPAAPTAPANDVTPGDDEPGLPPSVEEQLDRIRAQVGDGADVGPAAAAEDLPLPSGPDPAAVLATLGQLGLADQDRAAVAALFEPDSAPSGPEAPPEPSLREQVVAMLAADEPLAGRDLAGADLSGLDLGGRSLVGVNLAGARLAGTRLAGADLTDAQLSQSDLREASFAGATLERTDVSRARLDGASFADAVLTNADFSRARGQGASFRHARGERVQFVEAQLQQARFDEAELPSCDLSRATIDEAVFDQASLPAVRLCQVTGSQVSFRHADLADARGDEASLEACSFHHVRAAGSVWEGARLSEATFLFAAMPRASFQSACCARAIFSAADVTEGRLSQADLTGASLLEANLMKACFEEAELGGADLRGANLHGAALWRARLDGADLTGAIVTKTLLGGGE